MTLYATRLICSCNVVRLPLENRTYGTSWNSGRLLTPAQQNLDVLSTFRGCHLEVIQNPHERTYMLIFLPASE